MLAKPEDRRLQRSRVTIFAVIVGIAFAILLGRLWYLQVALGGELLKRSEENWNKLLRTRAPRGTILDCKGRVLATSRPQFVVLAIPEKLNEDREALHTLCGILSITPEDIEFAVKKSQVRPGSPVRVAVDVPIETVARIGELRMRLPGVSVELDQLRYYPEGPAVSHIMGSIGEIDQNELERSHETSRPYRLGDYLGKSGLERMYEKYLRGTDGGKRIKVNALGRVVKILGEKPSVPGKTLKLTIDRDLQIAADRALGNQVGAAVAVDPKTGAVLAMVSKPQYNPNVFVNGVGRSDWGRIIGNKAHPLQNRCVNSTYPPGSTFKPIAAVAGLTYGACTISTTVVCGGCVRLGRFRFGDWETHGRTDFTRAMAQSCDVWFYTMARRLGIEKLARVAKSFGVGSKTGIDLPSEAKGIMPDPIWKRSVKHEPWYPGDTLNSVIGQGSVELTPLQSAVACAAVADNGKIHEPYLVQEISEPDGRVVFRKKPKVARLVEAPYDAFGLVQAAMREAVVGGTGRACAVPGVAVAGKTGTAEKRGQAPHGWFICFAPVDNPKIAVACVVEHGRHGATSAAPVCRAVLEVFFHKKKAGEIAQFGASVHGD